MPIYEYQCENCHQTLEQMQKFSDPPLTVCPQCDGPVKKLMSMSSFALKGSGWYTTDYKRSSAAKPEAKPSEAPKTSPAPNATPAPTPSSAQAQTKSD